MAEYFHTWNLARGLWDRWQPTNEQARVWEKRLAPLNQDWLRDAIEEHFARSHWLRPDMNGILTIYHARAQNESTQVRSRVNWQIDEAEDDITRDGHAAIAADLNSMPRVLVLEARDEWFQHQLDRCGPLSSGPEVIRRRRDATSDDPAEWGIALRAYVWHWMNGAREQLTTKGNE